MNLRFTLIPMTLAAILSLTAAACSDNAPHPPTPASPPSTDAGTATTVPTPTPTPVPDIPVDGALAISQLRDHMNAGSSRTVYDLKGHDAEGAMSGTFTVSARAPSQTLGLKGKIGPLDGSF